MRCPACILTTAKKHTKAGLSDCLKLAQKGQISYTEAQKKEQKKNQDQRLRGGEAVPEKGGKSRALGGPRAPFIGHEGN